MPIGSARLWSGVNIIEVHLIEVIFLHACVPHQLIFEEEIKRNLWAFSSFGIRKNQAIVSLRQIIPFLGLNDPTIIVLATWTGYPKLNDAGWKGNLRHLISPHPGEGHRHRMLLALLGAWDQARARKQKRTKVNRTPRWFLKRKIPSSFYFASVRDLMKSKARSR